MVREQTQPLQSALQVQTEGARPRDAGKEEVLKMCEACCHLSFHL